jgi:hypothetical protein
MEDQHPDDKQKPGIKWYIAKRLTVAVVLIAVVVWAFAYAPKNLVVKKDRADDHPKIAEEQPATTIVPPPAPSASATAPADESAENAHTPTEASTQEHGTVADSHTASSAQQPDEADNHMTPAPPSGHTTAAPQENKDTGASQDGVAPKPTPGGGATAKAMPAPAHREEKAPAREAAAQEAHGEQASSHGLPAAPRHEELPTGAAFVDAAISPLNHELNQRFWGWRPNDIVNFTDNVNNFQLGVLEVTRRTVVMLAERIARTGTTDAFNPHLENAMNWLMVKADRYWFPAPESKYKESLAELKAYRQELLNGRASFYTRTDNLIPLLSSFEDLLGSCDENLVKQKNEEGKDVSSFKADDYFYYAKGVASTMATILEAIHHDFNRTLESRHAAELLHHAIISCQQAAALDPLLITNAKLDGIFANHRANMAAPISHARFYLGQLIKTLST